MRNIRTTRTNFTSKEQQIQVHFPGIPVSAVFAPKNKLGSFQIIQQLDGIAIVPKAHDLVKIRSLTRRSHWRSLVDGAFNPATCAYTAKHFSPGVQVSRAIRKIASECYIYSI